MNNYDINIQFPNHWLQTQVTVPHEDFEKELITVFTDPGNEEPTEPFQVLYKILADFYDFGAKYFAAGKCSGEDVAAKMNQNLGEIYLGNLKSRCVFHFIGVWPHSINFGELCYSSDPTVNIEVTWKFKNMEKINLCP